MNIYIFETSGTSKRPCASVADDENARSLLMCVPTINLIVSDVSVKHLGDYVIFLVIADENQGGAGPAGQSRALPSPLAPPALRRVVQHFLQTNDS